MVRFILGIMTAIVAFFPLISNAKSTAATFPAQLTIEVNQAPTPLVAANKNYLVYELRLTNFLSAPITLTSLEVGPKTKGSKTILYNADDLKNAVQAIGVKKTVKNPLVMEPGIARTVFMWLVFEKTTDIPPNLIHKVGLNAFFQGKNQTFSTTTLPLNIPLTSPVVVQPPLKGINWLAGDAPSNTSIHRRAGLVIKGHEYFAQRYAIDFIQIGENGLSYKGNEHQNSSYYCHGKEILAVASGKVVRVKEGVPENVPHTGKLAIDLSISNLPGNYVIIEIAKDRYACYGHLIPGSIQVKEGDVVKAGQVIARIGNSGNSSEPHLHFQVVDKNSFVGSNGVPYAFDHFATRPIKVIGDLDRFEFLSDTWQDVSRQLVLENALMKFSE